MRQTKSSDASHKYRQTSDAGYVYDQSSGAVLNTNDDEYESYKAQRARAKREQELMNRVLFLEHKILELEEKLNEVITISRR